MPMFLVTRRLTLCFFLVLCLTARAAEEDDDDFLATDPTATAELEKQVAALPPVADTSPELCVFLHKRGTAYLGLGRNDEAVADLKQALGLSQASSNGSWCGRWRIQADLRGAYHAAGDWLTLIEHAQSLSQEYKDHDPRHYFSTQIWLSDANEKLGRLRTSEEAFQRASAIVPSLRQHKGWEKNGAKILERYNTFAARMQELRGNHVEAERFRRAALRFAQENLDLKRSLFASDQPEVINAARTLSERKRNLAGILTTQGKTAEAEILALQSLNEIQTRSGGNNVNAAQAIRALATIKLQRGQIDEALRLLAQALSLLGKTETPSYSTFLADMRAQNGFLLGVQGLWKEALKVFEERDQGLRSNADQFALKGSNNPTWAMALLKNQRLEDAEKMLRAIVAGNLRKPFAAPLNIAGLRGYLAVVLVAAGKDDEALGEFRAALPVLIQQAETDNSSENGGYVWQYRLRLIAEAYLELLSRLADGKSKHSGFDPVTEAFQIAEVARGSSVQLAIASSAARATLPDSALADLARHEQDTANQINTLNKLLIRLASEPAKQRLDKTIANIRNDVAQLDLQQANLRRQLSERFPSYADLVLPKPPTPAAIQKVLQADEATVAFYVAEKKTYVWTITPTQLAFHAVELPRAQVDKQVATLRHAFDLSDGIVHSFDTMAAQFLYARLLAPDDALWANARLLNVIPHGSLGQLPFSALLTVPSASRRLADQHWLLKRIAIAQQPSAGTLISLRTKGRGESERRPFVGFGDPLFTAEATDSKSRGSQSVRGLSIRPSTTPDADADSLQQGFSRLPPLPDTALELNEIGKTLGANAKADIFLGSRATEGNAKSTDLSTYHVVAFATHGLVPGELPGLDEPSLALANPALTADKDNDGFLTLSEVLGLKLNADWVVLSACNTASGDGQNEEAVSGLGRAFFFAGTRRLLVSYWPVESVSARLLTTGLFKRQAAQPQESKAEALRHSMMELMTRSEEYSHPAFWAPFGLIGDAAK